MPVVVGEEYGDGIAEGMMRRLAAMFAPRYWGFRDGFVDSESDYGDEELAERVENLSKFLPCWMLTRAI